MRYLLDTHAFFWFIDDHKDLTKVGRETISEASNQILISPASYWEIAIKVSLGKWLLNRSYQELLDVAIKRLISAIVEQLSPIVLNPAIVNHRKEQNN